MCFNLKLLAATIKVVNETAADGNATIQLQSGNFTSNLTITYKPCSGEPSKIQFRPPVHVVHLVNLTADTTYCYSIASNGSSATQVAGSCNGTFADTTTKTPSTTGTNTFQSGYMNQGLHDSREELCLLSHNSARKMRTASKLQQSVEHSQGCQSQHLTHF